MMSESQKPTSATQIVLKFNRIKVYIVAIFPEIFRPIGKREFSVANHSGKAEIFNPEQK